MSHDLLCMVSLHQMRTHAWASNCECKEILDPWMLHSVSTLNRWEGLEGTNNGIPKIKTWNILMAEQVWLNCHGPTRIQWYLEVSINSPWHVLRSVARSLIYKSLLNGHHIFQYPWSLDLHGSLQSIWSSCTDCKYLTKSRTPWKKIRVVYYYR